MQLNLIYNSKVKILRRGKETLIPVGDLSIKKGGSYVLVIRVDEDYSGWLPRGEIRNNYLEEGGVLLASFSIESTYNNDTSKTEFRLRLGGDITTGLPVTNFQGLVNQTLSVTNNLVWDLELVDPNDSTNIIKLIEASFIQVVPEVTNGN